MRRAVHEDIEYAQAPLNGETVALQCTLYLPELSDAKPPLFVWFHGGAFKHGHHNQRMSKRLGRRLTRRGIAVASVQYRLRSEAADLSPDVAARVDAYQTRKSNLLRPGLCEFRSLAAIEDGVRFLDWASGVANHFGWSEKRILGGTSAGGITAFNIAFGAEHLGMSIPQIHGVFASSGGYNYPDFVSPRAEFRSLALHNPGDTRVSVRGVRMLKGKLGPQMELLESDQHIHGHCELTPGEPKFQTFDRIAKFVELAAQ